MSTKKYNLTESKTFCMAPWVHIHNIPSGDILPCCVGQGGAMGNLYSNSIEEIWNNEKFKTFRIELLNDIESEHCSRCYKEEEWGNSSSMRKMFNNSYSYKYDEMIDQHTDKTGYVSKMNFIRWDFRFSNLCNLACTTCSPDYSSTWGDIANKMDPSRNLQIFNSSKINRNKFIDTIKSQANNVSEIYFAGGEPLIQSEHYEILDYIESVGKISDIEFTYSTNLTSITYKSANVLEYWSKVKKLRLLISLDEIDAERLHYIRYPADVNKIVENIKIINSELTGNDQKWSITPTWSLMNMHRIQNIMQFFVDNTLLPQSFFESSNWEYDVHNIILMHPTHLSVSCGSQDWKKYLREKLDVYVEWYKDVLMPMKNRNVQNQCLRALDSNISRFYSALNEDTHFDQSAWERWINRLDEVRNTNFKQTFPELSWHFKK